MEPKLDQQCFTLLDLPPEIVEHVLTFLSYDEISQKRPVCKTFDRICRRLLNQGFQKADKLRANVQRDVKARLPRRESERRAHRLSRHADVLTAIETRISLLSMTYTKYMDLDLCCFIPGKVLDELFRVFKVMKKDGELPPSTDLLQELRDISSMAMEHFDDVISPGLKHLLPPLAFGPSILPTTSPTGGISLCDPNPPSPVHKDMSNMQQQLGKVKRNISLLSSCFHNRGKVITDLKAELSRQKRKMAEQEKKIVEQSRLIEHQTRTLNEHNTELKDLSKQLLDMKTLINEKGRKFAGGEPCVHTSKEGENSQSDMPRVGVTDEQSGVIENSTSDNVKSRRRASKRSRDNNMESVPISKRLREAKSK